jgi:hypothetical protein
MVASNLSDIILENSKIQFLNQKLFKHSLYSNIFELRDLHILMEAHVFAVWDFMSLVKRLQKSLTTVEIPWTPPNNSRCSRLLNEIVLGEESDLNINGDPQSHLEMYLEAMDEIGADSKIFRTFLQLVQNGEDVSKSLRLVNIPSYIVEFVEYTMKISLEGSLAEVMGCFFFGREDIIPRMFQNFLDRCKIDLNEAPKLQYYLLRHIDVDANEHGPAALKIMLDMFFDENEAEFAELIDAACLSIQKRIGLWDGVLGDIQQIASN